MIKGYSIIQNEVSKKFSVRMHYADKLSASNRVLPVAENLSAHGVTQLLVGRIKAGLDSDFAFVLLSKNQRPVVLATPL